MKMKKALALVLAASMALGSFSMSFADSAKPDYAGHENEAAIQRLIDLNLVKGYEDGSVNPEGNITRAEFAVMLVRVLGLEASAAALKGDTQFTDVTMTNGYDWATGAINVATKLGHIKGQGNGKFGPADLIKYEDAITMIVRALGYEPAANSKGGYPVGHLVVAERDLDLTDEVKASQGVAATRATVFQLLDNALTKPMMEQVGYGDEAKYEVPKENAKTLLSQLGYEKYTGRVIDFDADDLEITVVTKDGKEVLSVEEGFDFQAVHGVELTVWADEDDVVAHEVEEDALYDAIEVTKTEKEIKLIGEKDKYELTKDTIVFINGDKKDIEDLEKGDEYNYAKVVVDGDEVVFVSAYELDDFIVVEEVKDQVIYQADGEDLDVEDFTIVKGGKTISAEDLEENDVVFYNYDEEFAEVYNNSKEGKIERIFDNEVRIDGKEYEFGFAKYLDAGTFDSVDTDVLKEMEEEDEPVKYFLDRNNDLVFVIGTRAEVETNTFYGYVAADTKKYDTRGKVNWTFDVLNEEGKVVEYDVTNKFATDDFKDGVWANEIKEGVVVKVTVDEDGDIDEVKLLDSTETVLANDTTDDIDIDDLDELALGKYKLLNSTKIFWAEDETKAKDFKVMTLEEAAEKFKTVEAGKLYINKENRVVAMVVTQTDVGTESETLRGLVTKVRELRKNDQWEITIEIAGEEKVFLTDKDDVTTVNKNIEDTIVEIEVKDDMIIAIKGVSSSVKTITIKDLNMSKLVITATDNKEYELIKGAAVYDDELDEIRFRDLKKGDEVTVYLVKDSSRFVDYVLLGEAEETETPGAAEGKVTYIDAINKLVYVDGEAYEIGDNTLLKTAKGSIIAKGFTNISAALAANDEVTDVVVKDGVVVTFVATKIASIDVSAIDTEIESLPEVADVELTDKTAVDTAKLNYDALSPAEKDFVKEANVTKLNALVAKVAKLQADKDLADKQLLADAIDTEIESLPEVADVELTDKTAVDTAKSNYDGATADVQALVKPANVTKLNALVAKVAELVAEDNALTAINAATDGANMKALLDTHADTLGLTEYKALDGATKLNVANFVYAHADFGTYTTETLVDAIAEALQ